MASEQEEFLKELGVKQDSALEMPIEGVEPAKEETPEEQEMKLKNRRERRLSDKWQKEREANIALTSRLQAISESQNLRKETEESDYLKRVDKIYGNATPENVEATQLLKEALQGLEKQATERALERMEAERAKESEALSQEEKNLDEMLEQVEDDTQLDLSEGSADRKAFLTLLEKLSPKDKDGNIIEYADAGSTAEIYLSRKEKSNAHAKELAGRSMVHSGASQPSKLEDDAAVRLLKENGII